MYFHLAFELAVALMEKGEKCELFTSSRYAYGDIGRWELINYLSKNKFARIILYRHNVIYNSGDVIWVMKDIIQLINFFLTIVKQMKKMLWQTTKEWLTLIETFKKIDEWIKSFIEYTSMSCMILIILIIN